MVQFSFGPGSESESESGGETGVGIFFYRLRTPGYGYSYSYSLNIVAGIYSTKIRINFPANSFNLVRDAGTGLGQGGKNVRKGHTSK